MDYYCVDEEFSHTYEIKRSKFIVHLLPLNIFETRLLELKKQHPKARHFVTATNTLNEFSQIVASSSDDGEPKGTAGKPILNVLQGHNLVNCAVITVRYFGGIKLGTGGLVRAYGNSLNELITKARILPYVQQKVIRIAFSYEDIRQVEYAIKKEGIAILKKEFLERVEYLLQGEQGTLMMLLASLNRVTHIPHRQEDTKSKQNNHSGDNQ